MYNASSRTWRPLFQTAQRIDGHRGSAQNIAQLCTRENGEEHNGGITVKPALLSVVLHD